MADGAHETANAAIRKYASEAKLQQEHEMDVDSTDAAALEARLDRTIKELQERMEGQQRRLEELRRSSRSPAPTIPSTDLKERVLQLRAIRTAYERMTKEKPGLPSADSALPAILAARVIQQTFADTKKNISVAQSQLESVERQISREETQLSDAKLLAASLETRIARLKTLQDEKAGQSSSDQAKELIRAKQNRKHTFRRETEQLRTALERFIVDHLAAMLAAEELGGPVAGELMDVNEDMLTAGFSNQGKPRRSDASHHASAKSKRQQRIDDIWGGNSQEERSEKNAAAQELRELLDKMVSDSGYVELGRDSAAARLLIRAKVAEFHPKDARRMRLVDFARELDQ